jgi:hypothetical protein
MESRDLFVPSFLDSLFALPLILFFAKFIHYLPQLLLLRFVAGTIAAIFIEQVGQTNAKELSSLLQLMVF